MHKVSIPMPTHWLSTFAPSCRRVAHWNAMQATCRSWSMPLLWWDKCYGFRPGYAALPSFIFAIWWSGQKLWRFLPMGSWWIFIWLDQSDKTSMIRMAAALVLTMKWIFWWMVPVVTTVAWRVTTGNSCVRVIFNYEGHLLPKADGHFHSVIKICATLLEAAILSYLGMFLFSSRYH